MSISLAIQHARSMRSIISSSLACLCQPYFPHCVMNGMIFRGEKIIEHKMCELVSNYQLNAQFLYSITIYMLHYNPQHVSSSTLLILKRTNCIITASGIVTLCKQPYSMPVKFALNRRTVRPFADSDNTKGCNNTICPPEDEQGTARNMLRIIM